VRYINSGSLYAFDFAFFRHQYPILSTVPGTLKFYIVLLTSFPTNFQKLINFKRLVHEIIITP